MMAVGQIEDNYKDLNSTLNQYLKEKPTASTIANLDQHSQRRTVKNTYQIDSLRLKSLSSHRGSNVSTIQPNTTRPKSLIRIPKDIILHQISQKTDRTMIENIMNQREPATTTQQKQSHQRRNSFFESLLYQEPLNQTTLHSRNNSYVPTDKYNTLDPTKGQEDLLSQGSFQKKSFHITDLLETTFKNDKNSNKTNAIVEYYKRQVKDENDLQNHKEIMIKNYRLYVIKNENELTDDYKQLLLKNQGTTIYVDNSIISPDTFKFSTKVGSDMKTTQQLIDKARRTFYKLRKDELPKQSIEEEDQELNEFIKSFNLQYQKGNQFDVTLFENQYFNEDFEALNKGPDLKLNEKSSNQQKSRKESFQSNKAQSQYNKMISDWMEGLTNYKNQEAKANLKKQEEIKFQQRLKAQRISEVPTVRDINQSIMRAQGIEVLDQSIVPVNYEISQDPNFIPYSHLQATVLDENVKAWVQSFMEKSSMGTVGMDQFQQKLNLQDSLSAIDYLLHEFTHMDQHCFITDNLPAELFINYQKWIEPLTKDIEKWKILQENKIIKGRNIMAETEYFLPDITTKKIDVRLIDFDPQTAKFLVDNEQLKVRTWRSRLFMRLKNEPADLSSSQRIKVKLLMQETKEFQRMHRLILTEYASRYPYIAMPEKVKKNIQKRAQIENQTINEESAKKLVLQVEALYVYSIFKSILTSQKNDPNVKRELLKYKIPFDSEVLIYRSPKHKEKNELQNITHFNIKEAKISIDQNSLLLMDTKYIQLPIFLNDVTQNTISKHRLFKFPFDLSVLQSLGGDFFKKTPSDELNQKINAFPLNHKQFVSAQKVTCDFFHQIVKYRWSETIYKEVWNFVKDDFEYETGKQITEDQIDPVLRRLFSQLKLYMQTILQDYLQKGLNEYLKFLLGFLLRDPDCKKSSAIYLINSNGQFSNLFNKTFYQKTQTDLALISLKQHPFVVIEAIVENKAANKYYVQLETSSKPEVEKVQKDLFSVVTHMHDSLKNIDRVDKLVFPLLQLDGKGCLNPPDIKNNEELRIYIKVIDLIIDEGLRKTREKLSDINKFIHVFEKKTENIIIELKKKTFALQNNIEDSNQASDEESVSLSDRSIDVSPSKVTKKIDQSPNRNGGSTSPGINLAVMVAGDQAFKSIEIDENLFYDELNSLRETYWSIQEEISWNYDYGFVYLDCFPFKDKTSTHVKSLIDHLVSYAKKEFLTKMNSIVNDIVSVQSKLEENTENLDEVILLLDYIEIIKKPDNKVDELTENILELKSKMEFTNNLKIMFESPDYMQYLNLLNWPRTFRKWLEERKEQLQQSKKNLFYEMGNEKQMIFDKIEEFKKHIKVIKKEGLILESELVKMAATSSNTKYKDDEIYSPTTRRKRELMKQHGVAGTGTSKKDLTFALKARSLINANAIDLEQEEFLKMQKTTALQTFIFIAKEIQWDDFRFEPEIIEEVFDMTEQLKTDYDNIEKLTVQINKRETLLGVEQTEFKELRVIQDDLKPLYDLWLMASKFSKNFPIWMEGKFDQLDSEQIENNVNDWVNELKRLSKSNFIKNSAKQIELLSFIYQALTQFKQYLPMLKALRTKGLQLRHWRMIGNKLSFIVDPSTVTLWKLINLKLYEDEKLQIIKSICEIATKEYGVATTLDTLDREVKITEFEMAQFRDTDIMIVIKLNELIPIFDEYLMRVSVLKTNPHIRNFFDKMVELEKTVKSVVEIISEWQIFQKNWVYLEAIFTLEEMQKQLEKETKKFQAIDSFFKQCSKQFEQSKQVYKGCYRDAFYQSLQRFNADCESIMKGISDFLEQKREKFSRLYFLSNEEIIEIFGKGKSLVPKSSEQSKQNQYLGKLFEGIDKILVNEDEEICTIVSKEQEQLQLVKPIDTNTLLPEKQLKELERQMQNSVKMNLFLAYQFFGSQSLKAWIAQWPGQCTFTTTQIWFNQRVNNIFLSAIEIKRLQALDMQSHYGSRNSRSSFGNSKSNFKNSGDRSIKQSFMVQPLTDQSIIPQPKLSLIDKNTNSKDQSKLKIFRESVYIDEYLKNDKNSQMFDNFTLQDQVQLNTIQPAYLQMDLYLTEINETIQKFTNMVRRRLTVNIRQSTVNLIIAFVYYRDILINLVKNRILCKDDFIWQMQLKFQFKDLISQFHSRSVQDDNSKEARTKIDCQKLEVTCEVFNSERQYGFEYLGNNQRLIVTPLTERCQRSLLIAMHYFYGGAPEGPVGTGKTETTKDLGKQLAKLCFVMNCSSNFDYSSVVRFFKGLASSGSWVCFDEFNRMDSHILSLISQVIIAIQSTIKKQSPSLFIDETKITINNECAIFITLNPGYAGRTELPLNLKNLFRSISMVVPDSVLITEILLYSAGFTNSQSLAKKIVSIMNLASCMVHQNEFNNDFGLRSIKAIVNLAENFKLLSQGIIENELTHIIDDTTANKMPYKSSDVIKTFISSSVDFDSSDKQKQVNKNDTFYSKYSSQMNIRDEQSDSEEQQSFKPKKNEKLQLSKKITDGTIMEQEPEINNEKEKIFSQIYGGIDKYDDRHMQMVYEQLGIPITQRSSEAYVEELIILKSLKDYNKSKFSGNDCQIFEGIIEDIFQDKQQNIQKKNEYFNLRNCIDQSFQQLKLEPSNPMVEKVLQLYEIQKIKHGIIVVGECQSGKSTLIKILETALNKSSGNELNLLIAQKRISKLKEFTKDIDELNKTQQSFKKTHTLLQSQATNKSLESNSTSNNRTSRISDTKSIKAYNILVEVYKKTQLTEEELQDLKQKLVLKGVDINKLNPKSMNIHEMFGKYDEDTHQWHEGIFTALFRDFSLDKTSRKKWIVLDGPVDSVWVENLNSILDENRKMSLANGESILMSNQMALILETDKLIHTTPATISRCGLLQLSQKEYMNPKFIFNSWLRQLPQNLNEYTYDIENYCNVLISDAFKIFDECKKTQNLLFYQIDKLWIIKNFLRLLDSLILDYRNMAAEDNTKKEMNASKGGESLQNNLKDSTDRISINPSMRQSQGKFNRSQLGFDHERTIQKRGAANKFITDEIRYENAIKFTGIWIESFIIFAIAWTFGSILDDFGKQLLDEKLKERIEANKMDFATYQKLKKKAGGILAGQVNLSDNLNDRDIIITDQEQTNNMKNNQNMKQSIKESINLQLDKTTKSQNLIRDIYQLNLTNQFTDQVNEQPKFISDFPQGASIYEVYLSLDQSNWQKFNLERNINQQIVNYHNLPDSLKKVSNLFIPTMETIRYLYLIECLVISQQSTLLIGPGSSGKSEILKQGLFTQVFQYSDDFLIDHMTLSLTSDSLQVKRMLERKLEIKSIDSDIKQMKPIDDLHMPERDKYDQQSANEVLRDYFTMGGWYQSKNKRFRQVFDMSIFGALSTFQSSLLIKGSTGSQTKVSLRTLHHFNLIGIDESKTSQVKQLYQIIIGLIAINWPSEIQQFQGKVVQSILELYNNIQSHLKPTPAKVHYQFNWRDLFKIANGLILVETNYLKSQTQLMKIVYHECLRVFTDKVIIYQDYDWITSKMKEVFLKHFDLKRHSKEVEKSNVGPLRKNTSPMKREMIIKDTNEDEERPDFPIQIPEDLYFSIFNQDVEGFYTEVENTDQIQEIIERLLFKYNDSNERQHINLILFKEINKLLMKLVRIFNTQNGHALIIAIKGSGVSVLHKLACFALGHYHKQLEMIPNFTTDEWRLELKKLILKAGQEDKHTVFFVDQFLIQNECFYDDMECILKNGINTDILLPSDIDFCLSVIHQQLEQEKAQKKMRSSLTRIEHSLPELSLEFKQMPKEQQQQYTNIMKNISKNNTLRQELYSYFLKRVKNNLHISLCYSPTGEKFKERLLTYQTFLTCCNMIWFQDLNRESLQDLGMHFIEYIQNKGKMPSGPPQKPKRNSLIQQHEQKAQEEVKKSKDQLENKRILNCCVQMYIDCKDIAKRFFSETDQILYFTPSLFIDMFSNYRRLYEERQKSVSEIQQRYEKGLEKIRQTQMVIQEFHLKLESRTPQLQDKQRNMVHIIGDLEDKFALIKKERDNIKREEFMINQETEQALQIKNQCEEALNKVIPALNEAVNSIQSLSKHDLSELKAMKKPPKVIKLVMKGVCILLNVPPQRKKCKDGITFKDSFWSAAQGKDVLGNSRLPDLLIEFDRNKVTIEQMKFVEEIVQDTDYTYENAYRASKAATGMFKWVRAIREYYYIFQEIEPRRDAFMLSEKQHQLKVEELQVKRKQLQSLEEHITVLQKHQEENENKCELLRIEINDCKMKKKRADILLRSLASEKQKWIVCTRMLSGKYLTVNGDVLLSAAYVSLLSGFTNKFRNKLIKRWRRTLYDQGLPVSDTFNFNDLFGDSMKIREWQINGLPHDQPSINNAIIMEKTKKYCICIDPQFQANYWLKNQYYDQGLIITKYGELLFRKSLEIALEVGKPVLIENIGEKIDQILYSILNKDVIKHGNSRLIKFARKTYKFDKSFNLFLTTSLKSPHFDVDVGNISTVVNFQVTFDGLQQQMLSLVVANERPDLEEKYIENTKDAFENIKQLREIENTILLQLDAPVEKLLGEETLIKTLNESRNTAEYIAQKLKQINQTSQFMQRSRELFSPVAKRASLLYFVVQDLSKINSMYQFSLSQFTNIFTKAMQMTNQFKPSNLNQQRMSQNSSNSNNKTSSLVFFTAKITHDERIQMLIKAFTQDLYKKVNFSIFEKDRMLFTYLIAFRVLEFDEFLDKNLYNFLLGGPRNPDYSEEAPKELKLNWLNTRSWGDLKQLAQVRPFNQENLIESLKQNPNSWDDFYNSDKFAFEKLPNLSLINIQQMLPEITDEPVNINEEINKERLNTETEDSFEQDSKQSMSKSSIKESNPLIDDQVIQTNDNQPLTRNVSSVLNDEDLWHVSSSSDEEDLFMFKKRGTNSSVQDSQLLNDEEELALYLVDVQQTLNQVRADPDENIKVTQQEQEIRRKKEAVLKSQIEMCILRCIRPDKISNVIDTFLNIVIDTKYTSFQEDVMKRYKVRREALQASSKKSQLDLKSIAQFTLDQASHKQKYKDSPPIHASAQITNKFITVLREVFEDSNKQTPIFFLITHSMNVYQQLIEFQRSLNDNQLTKLQYISLGKGLEKKVEDKITKASQSGDWLLLENLHLMIDWLVKLEEMIMHLDKQEVNPRFRLFFSSVAVDNFPPSILQMSIKVSLQPPTGIKSIMERMLTSQEPDIFRKSRQNSNLHKNIFFSLCYFHAILEGRKKYGPLGWNIPYQFDFADFEISALQLFKLMRKDTVDDDTNLSLMTYLIGEINYAGKIQRNEDHIVLKAIIDDLFSKDITFNKGALDQDLKTSHYGFPLLSNQSEFSYYVDFVQNIPDNENEQIFGFNENIERLHSKNLIFAIFRQVNKLNTKTVPFNNPLDIKTKDENDIKVREIALGLLKTLDDEFSLDQLNEIFPMKYEDPITVLIHREVNKYNNLLRVIKKSLADLVNTIDGSLQSSTIMEKLWFQILFNYVPDMWLHASYPTCYRNLGDYIVNLNERLHFVRNWIDNGKKQLLENKGLRPLAQYWLPGFFDQISFLTSLRQKLSRKILVSLDYIVNEFEVMNFMEAKAPCEDEFSNYVYGLWLEGAQWNIQDHNLEESTTNELYLPFPVVKIKTVAIKKENAEEKKFGHYSCPVFKTTMRLANNIVQIESEPITHVPLKTKEEISKWTKRSVALILDIHN